MNPLLALASESETLFIFILGAVAMVGGLLTIIALLVRWAPVLEDCRWCGALCDKGHTLCPQCRAIHEQNPTAKH